MVLPGIPVIWANAVSTVVGARLTTTSSVNLRLSWVSTLGFRKTSSRNSKINENKYFFRALDQESVVILIELGPPRGTILKARLIVKGEETKTSC